MREDLRAGGRLQFLTLVGFLIAACLAGIATINGNYVVAAIGAAGMIVNLATYRYASSQVARCLQPRHRYIGSWPYWL